MSIYRGPGGAGDATNDATSQSILAAASAVAAANSEAAAAASATSAASSASAASTSATNASNSATAAAASATNAANSATSAASSASTATTKASEAATSATNAASSATSAATSATNASNSATSAASSASTATTKAAEASTSATAAAASATAAATSEANADISEANAASSATAAATSATNASNSASAAATSATNAANSASTATTQASNAASSATAAATSASNASTSATNASNSASAAATSATNASNSASAASTSATNAANSATAAAASYDSFDDRYLGSKTSNPTLDNDGNALLTGALYWNSTVGEMRVYNGSAWVAAYVPAATYVAKAGDVMTGSLEVPTQASLKATALTRASIRPSLLLDFANTKQLDPRITFSRPTTATYYDGKTVVKAEENLLTSSDTVNYVATQVTTVLNSAVAPNGTTTGTTVTAVSGTSAKFLGTFSTLQASTAATISVYAKAGTHSYIQFVNSGDSQAFANFDLTAGAGVVGTKGSKTTSSIVDAGNGWYRCIATFDSTTAYGTTTRFYIAPSASATYGQSVAAAGTESVYLWGAQLEQRSTVTAYTPTTTAPITNYIPVLQTAAAGVPRFDHDPVTGESKGFLIEEQRTNLLTYSDQFDNAVWNKTNTTVDPNVNVAPDGTLTADKLVATTTSGLHGVQRFLSGQNTDTHSVFVKAAGYTKVGFKESSTTGWYAAFDLSSGTILSYTPNATPSIQSVGNGWYRISMVAITSNAGQSIDIRVLAPSYTSGDVNASTFAGDGYSGLYIWGAQLEAGSFPTSYIPTVASQVTRSADTASMTGANFSSWYRADEGTLYAEAIATPSSSAAARIVDITDSTGSTQIDIYRNAGNVFGFVYKSGVNQANISLGSVTAGTGFKAAVCYKLDDIAGSNNGATVVTDTSASIPIVDRMFIGNLTGVSSSQFINNCIKRIAYYPKRLSNTELQGLTS